MKYVAILVALAGLVAFMLYKPSAGSRVDGLRLEQGGLVAGGETYDVTWDDATELAGDARILAAVYNKGLPVITHDLVLTSGDFSDPAKVDITSRGGGNYVWRAKEKPEGSALFLHVIPASPAVLEAVQAVATGQAVVLRGRKAKPAQITRRSDQAASRLNHDNHAFFLLEELRAPAAP